MGKRIHWDIEWNSSSTLVSVKTTSLLPPWQSVYREHMIYQWIDLGHFQTKPNLWLLWCTYHKCVAMHPYLILKYSKCMKWTDNHSHTWYICATVKMVEDRSSIAEALLSEMCTKHCKAKGPHKSDNGTKHWKAIWPPKSDNWQQQLLSCT